MGEARRFKPILTLAIPSSAAAALTASGCLTERRREKMARVSTRTTAYDKCSRRNPHFRIMKHACALRPRILVCASESVSEGFKETSPTSVTWGLNSVGWGTRETGHSACTGKQLSSGHEASIHPISQVTPKFVLAFSTCSTTFWLFPDRYLCSTFTSAWE